MDTLDDFDPSLFGPWAKSPAYGDAFPHDETLMKAVRTVPLETKSAEPAEVSPAEALRRLLNEMTIETREQFAAFRRMRTSAEKALEDGDEAAQKLARADVKAAADAMSLIVRTLEKVDGLQRQLARDREIEADRAQDEVGYEEAKARFMKMIEDRAYAEAIRLFDAWKSDGPPPAVLARLERGPPEPEDEAAGAGEEGGQDGGCDDRDSRAARPQDAGDHQGA